MQPALRREKIIALLSLRRRDTMQNLADELGVSWDTIQRDIWILEEQYPLIVTPGRGGGIFLPKGYYVTQKRLMPLQAKTLRELLPIVSDSERVVLQSILNDFALPE